MHDLRQKSKRGFALVALRNTILQGDGCKWQASECFRNVLKQLGFLDRVATEKGERREWYALENVATGQSSSTSDVFALVFNVKCIGYLRA